MTIEKYNLPIKVFYGNLLRMGIRLKVKDGQLRISGNRELVTPVLRVEIEKRAEHLVDLLSPQPPQEMASHFGRLLTLDELKTALTTAQFLQARVDACPVNGGWILTMQKEGL